MKGGRPWAAPARPRPILALVPIAVGAASARLGEVQRCYLVRAPGVAVAVDFGAGAMNRLQDRIAPEALEALVINHLHRITAPTCWRSSSTWPRARGGGIGCA